MLLQITVFDVVEAWDAHVVVSEVTPTGRSWAQLGHDLIDGAEPGAAVSDQLRRVSAYLTLLAGRYDEIEARGSRAAS